MEDFDLGEGLKDMREYDLAQGAIGSYLVKKSYRLNLTREAFDLVE